MKFNVGDVVQVTKCADDTCEECPKFVGKVGVVSGFDFPEDIGASLDDPMIIVNFSDDNFDFWTEELELLLRRKDKTNPFVFVLTKENYYLDSDSGHSFCCKCGKYHITGYKCECEKGQRAYSQKQMIKMDYMHSVVHEIEVYNTMAAAQMKKEQSHSEGFDTIKITVKEVFKR